MLKLPNIYCKEGTSVVLSSMTPSFLPSMLLYFHSRITLLAEPSLCFSCKRSHETLRRVLKVGSPRVARVGEWPLYQDKFSPYWRGLRRTCFECPSGCLVVFMVVITHPWPTSMSHCHAERKDAKCEWQRRIESIWPSRPSCSKLG